MSPAPEGPCSLRVRAYDAVSFLASPSAATPLSVANTYVDSCGWYRLSSVTQATFGIIAIATEDAMPTGAHRLAAVFRPNVPTPAAAHTSIRTYATRVETDTAWSASLSGATFADRGVVVPIFRHGTVPQAGVTVHRAGTAVPADDFYFSDADGARHTIDAARTSTGPNGTALVLNSGQPTMHSGVGGEPTGCFWSSALLGTAPGVVLVHDVEAMAPDGGLCP